MESKKYWFKKRRWGYGWTPSTWQGWLAMAVSVGLIVLAASLLAPKEHAMGNRHNLAAFFIIAALDLCVLVLICVQKGEPQR